MKNRKEERLRLATLVTAGVCATVAVTMFALFMLVDHFAANYAREQANERLQQLSWQMRDSLDLGMQQAVNHVRTIADLPVVRDADDAVVIRQIFSNIRRHFPDYAWIGLTDQQGKVLAGSEGLLEGVDVSQHSWFSDGKISLFTDDYHPAVLLENKLPESDTRWRFVDIAFPVTHSNGEFRGVLGVYLSWEWARGIAHELLMPTAQQYQVEVIVVRDDGMIILGPDYLEETTVNTDSVKLARNGGTGAIVETWPNGRRYLTGYAQTGLRTPDFPVKWSILIRQPEEIALADFRDLQHQILLVGGGIGLLLALVAIALGRRLAKPLDDLSAAILDQAQDGAIKTIPITDSYQEVHLLSMTLAHMVERERQHVMRLHALNENLENLVHERTSEIEKKALALETSLAQQLEIQTRLKDSETELRAILHNANDAFIAIDQDGIIVEWNEQAEHLLGWTRAEACGRQAEQMIVPPAQRAAYVESLQDFLNTGTSKVINRRIEVNALRRDGLEFPVELAVASVPRHNGRLFIAFLHDITERQRLQTTLTNMALKDALTDLPNRRALMQKLPEAIVRAARLGKPLAVLFLDLDGFKGINDGYGHEAGDELLRTMGQRIVGVVRATDTVVRLAGDEFVVVLEMLNGDADALEVADKILQAIQQPFVLSAATVSLSGSIGIAMHWPEDLTHAEQLITLADGAMYAAKKQGKNRAVAV